MTMFQINQMQDITVVELLGEFDSENYQRVRGLFDSLLARRQSKVVLDFSAVDHVNYRVLNDLVKDCDRFRLFKGDLKCTRLNEYNRNIFKFAGASRLLENCHSMNEALLSFEANDIKPTWH